MDIINEIKETIEIYKLACKPENLNYDYCVFNDINMGICRLCKIKGFLNLQQVLFDNGYKFVHISPTPYNLLCMGLNNPTEMKLRHEHRIKYLEDLLKTQFNLF
jgi:hypothetical protein